MADDTATAIQKTLTRLEEGQKYLISQMLEMNENNKKHDAEEKKLRADDAKQNERIIKLETRQGVVWAGVSAGIIAGIAGLIKSFFIGGAK